MHRRTGSIFLVLLVAALAGAYFVLRRPTNSPITLPEPLPEPVVTSPNPLFAVDPPAHSPVQALMPSSLAGQDLFALAQAADRLPENLNHGEQAALIRFLHQRPAKEVEGAEPITIFPAIRHDAYVFLANQVMDALLRQRNPHPMLVEGLISSWENATLDTTVRDYALQHLGAWLHRHLAETLAPEDPTLQEKRVIETLFAATQPVYGHSSGTALLALHHALPPSEAPLPQGPSSAVGPTGGHLFDPKRLSESVERVALNSEHPVTARCTALQIAAQRGWLGVLPEARRILASATAPAQLAASAAAAVGALGDLEQDGPTLIRRRESPDPRIAASTKAALARLELRSSRTF
jgi:hypothetical protein